MNSRLSQISDMMSIARKRGNPRDFVLLVGGRLVDGAGEFDAPLTAEATAALPVGRGVVIVHKSELAKLVGADIAARFWSTTLRRRLVVR